MPTAKAKKLAERWSRIPTDGPAIVAGCYFDPEAAEAVCDFFETFLHHSKGEWAGKLFALEPWQRDYLSRLYGWMRPNGSRRFRETFLEVAKKNGKSSLFSGIGLYGLVEEPGAEVYLGATTRKQAGKVFEESARMVRSSPDLSRHLRVTDYTKTIGFPMANARLETMSADADSQDGANASHTILDECHRFKNSRLYDVMKYAGRARRQPLLVNITTAGVDRNSLCYRLYQRSKAILAGTLPDLFFLPLIYEADPSTDDLDDPRTWQKANPSMGVLFSQEDFGIDFAEAKRIPSEFNKFLRLSLNVWTETITAWLPLPLWDSALEAGLAMLPGMAVYAAIDCSTNTDLTSVALVAVVEDPGADPLDESAPPLVKAVAKFFVPKLTAEARAHADKVPYPDWIDAGLIIGTEGNSTDYKAISRLLVDLQESGVDILKVGCDPWNAHQLMNDLADLGFDVVEVRQGYRTMSPACKELERLLLAGLFRHDGSPVLRWNVANIALETDAAENVKPSKARSAERIDGAVAVVMGIGLAMSYPNLGGPSYTPAPRGN